MDFDTILSEQGLTPEQIEAIKAAMVTAKIYTTTLENAAQRYERLKSQKEAVDAELKTANETIGTLKTENASNADLQAKVTAYEQQVADLQAQAATQAKTYALTGALKDAGVIDPEYLIYKHGGLEKFTFDADGKPIGTEEILKGYRESSAFLFKSDPKPGGYNPAGGTGGAAKNPFAKETYNLTEQGKLFRENPEQARALAAAAGVTL